MTFLSRATRVLLPFVLLVPVPAYAQFQGTCTITATAADMPQYAEPDDPWIYRGTDIPVDEQWLFGELPNGVRYAVRENGVPPCQMSLRVAIDAGSLHERDEERGFAHLLEHMVFRESVYFGPGEAIPHFQRLGAALGADTNASTTPTQTVYKLDLPDATRSSMDESIRLFTGMVTQPTLSSENVATDVPIVLSERRERAGPARRVQEATTETLFAGQRLANRSPIGTVETLQGATAEAVQDFHQRWYRPENAVVVLVGDADVEVLASMVEKHFADWDVPGEPVPAPDFGDPEAPEGANGENPVGEVDVIVEPGQARALTYAIMRPWVQVVDNLEYNRQNLLKQVAAAIVNRRLENRARAGGSFLLASVQRNKVNRSVDGTFVSVTPLGDNWEAALADVRGVIADARSAPPSQAEIDQAVSLFDVAFVDMVEQSRIQAGSQLADQIVQAVDIREAVASPETFLEVFRSISPRFTPDQVLEATQELFTGEVVRAVMLTPKPGSANIAQLRAALEAPAVASADARDDGEAIDIADLPPIGEPVLPSVREPLGVLDVERLRFDNGVQALLMSRDNEPGRVTVRVRFGAGWRGFEDDEAAYAHLAPIALVNSGVGPLDQNDLDRAAAGSKLGFDFHIEDGAFVFEGLTRQEDLAAQLYLFAAKLQNPGWDPAPFERAKASALLGYGSYNRDPGGVLNRDLDWLLRDRDPRFVTPAPEMLEDATAEGFRRTWSRLLSQGPVEVAVFGDIDREATVEALSRTFGAIDPRMPLTEEVANRDLPFPDIGTSPIRLTHEGDADQAAAVIAWPTAGGSDQLVQSRKLDLLAQIFSIRLMDGLRERAGAAYSPYVTSSWPLDTETGGLIFALAQLDPAIVPEFFEEAEAIAEDLAANGPSQDELARVVEPISQRIQRASTGHTFWLNQLQGAAGDANRALYLRSLLTDYTSATPEELQAVAQRYLVARPGLRISVLPDDAGGTRANVNAGR
ncbi:M16 family metallopeptidase [Aurantiacibacter poecillastricola]|uniref:M16 family metallopeptidase n=1 Tax=Aurantiacibacter poecillastricola TaxID=3064385 RepID=UPI00273F73F1|nr:M16 family metallopeptidase [Aurantiacibacter sp. 219JJ12-13]MDP5261544.1 insulinase family protein [Aurantiacibacter sp. 219JJ12-13]